VNYRDQEEEGDGDIVGTQPREDVKSKTDVAANVFVTNAVDLGEVLSSLFVHSRNRSRSLQLQRFNLCPVRPSI
jgi:hypothetical protein